MEVAAKAVGADVTFWYVDSADHVRTPAVYPEEFEGRIVGFYRGALLEE